MKSKVITADRFLGEDNRLSPKDECCLAIFMRNRLEDDRMLALNPSITRAQLIRDRLDKLVSKFYS
jgi:hypothetical protein